MSTADSQELDVYRDWLGVKIKDRPLNHYQLLRLDQFDDDQSKIRAHYRKLNKHIKKYAAGDYAKQSQELLNELARAMLCLTDKKRKEEYDAGLGRKEEAHVGLRSLDQILLSRKLVSPEQLEKVRRFADATGLDVKDAVVQQKITTSDVATQCYAESVGLPYLELADIQLDGSLIVSLPAQFCRQYSIVPIMRTTEDYVLIACPNMIPHEAEDELRHRLDKPIRCVLCTPASLHDIIEEHYSRETAAAEMQRGGFVAAKSSPKKGVGGGSKKKESTRDPEEKKKIVLAGGMLTGVGTLMALQLALGFSLTIAIPVGLVVGGIVAGVLQVSL